MHIHEHTYIHTLPERPCWSNLLLNFYRALSLQSYSSFQYSCQFWAKKKALTVNLQLCPQWEQVPVTSALTCWRLSSMWLSDKLGVSSVADRGAWQGTQRKCSITGQPIREPPFSASPAYGSSLFRTHALSFSAHSCRASTGRKLYYGWVNLLINIQPLDPAFPRWPIKNYNWQRT